MAVTDEAITKIKEMLINGQLKAGDRLPPENELSDQLGLSRSSLREAVKALELIRVLDVRRGDGTYVTSLEPGLLTETMGFMVEIHQESSASELLEVRRILEPGAAAHAAGRIDSRAVAALRACLDAVPPHASAADLAAHDFSFHSHIARASGNPYLAGLLDSLTGSALRLRIWQRVTEAEAEESVLGEHAAILEALTMGDAELARSLMTVHVASAERWLRRQPKAASTVLPPASRTSHAESPAPASAPWPGTPPLGAAPTPGAPTTPGVSAPSARSAIPSPAKTAAVRPRIPARKRLAGPSPAPSNEQMPVPAPAQVPVPAPLQAPAPERVPAPVQAQAPAPVRNPVPSSTQVPRQAPQIARIAPDPALYELFSMPSVPGQKAARKPRRPA